MSDQIKSDKTKISRRTFLGIAGATLGASAIAGNMPPMLAGGPPPMGHPPMGHPPQRNETKVDADSFKEEQLEADVLVIGSGIAGLFAAVKAHDAGAKVVMVSKGRLGSSGLTPFGKGVFSYDKKNPKMQVDEYLAKVAESSIGTNNPVFTRQLLEHSADRVAELKEWGFFDSALCFESFSKPMKARKIPIIERIMMTHLHKKQGRVVGASGFSLDHNTIFNFSAKTVVLCTGSGGFKANGFPLCDLTHDGTIMAYNIGAKVTGKEWNDGHPASAKNSGSSYDNWHGQIEEKPSTTSEDIHHDLGVDLNYTAYTKGGPVSMGPPSDRSNSDNNSGADFPSGPYIPESFRHAGGPPPQQEATGLSALFAKKKRQGPPNMGGESVGGSTAGMAIHKSEGLVPIDETGLSTIPGLWASGDALGSYMSGGIYTQVGSSMAGSAVQGAIAGEAAAKASKTVTAISIPKEKLTQTREEILAPLKRESGYSPAWVTQTLQSTMIPNFVLYIKKERMMQAALAYIEELKEHHGPMIMASDRHHLRLAHETMHMIITAEMKLKASMMRTESRCSHYRLDYPEIDTENWQAWINIHKDENGEMKLEKQHFDKWPEFA
ncbi:FAD-binding protein [Cocleimonas sp. KMM 6892]|uniref:FAD-binding protein n=1 Tax=unclassified Cocleimonas TaxID=2639732 RepID=UPI002DBFDBAF|nr:MULTISPECIES: FAD-binding protein [unclassified Cocleimonas]MEB8433880.1 FAD-binding protein [Cocleimonas sp. KMM 6892]MEC4716691.1 FAD-binding protein [Cocleimonas sp. KMM 6895]MEC4746154.1 FAD-binding protein [Cocleimonas sp. KMM 6896]